MCALSSCFSFIYYILYFFSLILYIHKEKVLPLQLKMHITYIACLLKYSEKPSVFEDLQASLFLLLLSSKRVKLLHLK